MTEKRFVKSKVPNATNTTNTMKQLLKDYKRRLERCIVSIAFFIYLDKIEYIRYKARKNYIRTLISK